MQKELDRENNCHSVGTYYPALIVACYSFHTHDGLRKDTRPLIWKYVSHHERWYNLLKRSFPWSLLNVSFWNKTVTSLQIATQYQAQFDQGIKTFRLLYRKLNSHFLCLYFAYSSSGEMLLKYQLNLSYVTTSKTRRTTLFYTAQILQGEKQCGSFIGIKGLRVSLCWLTCLFG